jgi:hypothetical protein
MNPMEAELFYADGWTAEQAGRQTTSKLTIAFLNFANASKKGQKIMKQKS